MKSIFLSLSLFLLTACSFAGLASVDLLKDDVANNAPICTQEYAPVCGEIQVQCFAAPCNPVKQTFSNSCFAKAAGAKNITEGECK